MVQTGRVSADPPPRPRCRRRMTKHARNLLLAAATLVLVVVPTAAAKSSRAAATTVTVTAGKPSEFGFKLSTKKIAHGAITFTITNGGNVPHDFKVCSKATTSAPVDTCAGKGTTLISPGTSKTLKVTLAKAGTYEYLCTVARHATAGVR